MFGKFFEEVVGRAAQTAEGAALVAQREIEKEIQRSLTAASKRATKRATEAIATKMTGLFSALPADDTSSDSGV